MSNIKTESPLVAEVVAGGTHTQEGVPLGLVNYMVHNREQFPIPLSRVENKVGTMYFKGKLPRTKRHLFIWDEIADLWPSVHDDEVRLT